MKTYENDKYPVFEAEQVLSHSELNKIISYFDEQGRLSRTKLIGVGILDGMELTFPNVKSVHIACGTGVTSLGFLINFKETTFTHYFKDQLSDEFIGANYSKEPFLSPVLDETQKYIPLKNCLTLLTTDSDIPTKSALPDGFFDDKLLIILLEIKLIDLKNCVSGDCDDKGKRIEFNTKVIAVEKALWGIELFNKKKEPVVFKKLHVPRFNSDNKYLKDANTVFDAFKKLTQGDYIDKLSQKIKELHDSFENDIDEKTDISALTNVKQRISDVVSKTSLKYNYQYIYDWILDITDCYNEIISQHAVQKIASCKQPVTDFPLHLVLGGNTTDSAAYRTGFYPVSKTGDLNELQKENLNLLFQRLSHILQEFKIASGEIKITPSRLGNVVLSQKAIPFYYDKVSELKRSWETVDHSYTQEEPLAYYDQREDNNPLQNNLDDYNFFRVEGHIGKSFEQAAEELQILQNSYRLPFEITAVNAADFTDKEISIDKFKGRWDDIETDYDLAKMRFINISEYVMKWIDENKADFNKNGITLTAQNIVQLQELLDGTLELLTEDLMEFLGNYENFARVFGEMNSIFLLHKRCMQRFTNASTIIADELYSRMDDINELFLENPFLVLYEEAYRRWELLAKKMSFENFYAAHPSLEHRAGVTKGGTLVLVNYDETIFKKKNEPVKPERKIYELKSDLLISKIDNYKNIFRTNFNFENAEIEKISTQAKRLDPRYLKRSNVELEAKTASTQKETQSGTAFLEVTDERMIKKMKDVERLLQVENPGVSKEVQERIIGQIFERVFGRERAGAVMPQYQNRVIADFYLPYICCSDSPPLQILLERTKPIAISMAQTKFCRNDETGYTIHIDGPKDGIFLGETSKAISKTESDEWLFIPMNMPEKSSKELTIQYSAGGISSNILEITVESPEELQWKATQLSEPKNSYLFSLDGDSETEYIFNFGDGSEDIIVKDKEIEHPFNFSPNNPSFTVSIAEKDSLCRNYQEITITTGDFDNEDYNENDFSTR